MIKDCTNNTQQLLTNLQTQTRQRPEESAVAGQLPAKADIKPVNGLCDKLTVLSYSNN